MIEKGLYYATDDFKKMIKSCGGEWNDSKHRPMVCLIKSSESNKMYWAIPMGNFNHRTAEQQERIKRYMSLPETDIRSCYYHLGRTTTKSIFFISDAIPITDEYILEEHKNISGDHYIIKNPRLLSELERKLRRILSVENSKPNFYRQHITDVKTHLLSKL